MSAAQGDIGLAACNTDLCREQNADFADLFGHGRGALPGPMFTVTVPG